MTPEEFRNLKTGTADPLTPENVLASALWRLEYLQKLQKKGRTYNDPRETDAEWCANIAGRISEICRVLGVHMNEDGSIQPTHYYN
jgi:hypothetical protein